MCYQNPMCVYTNLVDCCFREKPSAAKEKIREEMGRFFGSTIKRLEYVCKMTEKLSGQEA